MVLKVISSSRPAEKEFTDAKGRRFQLRILPYRMSEGTIDGGDNAPRHFAEGVEQLRGPALRRSQKAGEGDGLRQGTPELDRIQETIDCGGSAFALIRATSA